MQLGDHFAIMAEKGWMIYKMGIFCCYRAIEPCKLRFHVKFFPEIGLFDYPHTKEVLKYRQQLEDAGWSFVTSRDQINIFCAREDISEPITSHSIDYTQNNIHIKEFQKKELPVYILSILVLTALSLLFVNYATTDIFLSDMIVFMMIAIPILYVTFLWHFMTDATWYVRSQKAFSRGLPLPVVDYHLWRIQNKAYAAVVVVMIICYILGAIFEFLSGNPRAIVNVIVVSIAILSWSLIQRKIETVNRKRQGNISIYIVFVVVFTFCGVFATNVATQTMSSPEILFDQDAELDGRPALTLNAIGVTSAPEQISLRKGSSIVVPISYVYEERYNEDNVFTDVKHSIFGVITRRFYDDAISRFSTSQRWENARTYYLVGDQATYWGADEGIMLDNSQSIFHYDISSYTRWLQNRILLVLLKDRTMICLIFTSDNMDLESISFEVRKLWIAIDMYRTS